MYLTMQRVASVHGERGLNGALYSHGADREHPMWESVSAAQVASGNVGTQVARRTDIGPGGNAVECFIDVVFPDDVTEVELRTALQRIRNRIDGARVSRSDGVVSVEFSQNLGEGSRLLDNYDQLTRAALQLFRTNATGHQATCEPIEIIATVDESGWHFALTPASRERVLQVASTVRRVNVPLDVADDFRQMYGALYPFVMEWVTNLTREQLNALGGVRIVQDETNVWEWPSSRGPTGH